MPTPPLPEETRALILTYLKQGYSVSELIKRLKEGHGIKISHGTVSNVRLSSDVGPGNGPGRYKTLRYRGPGLRDDKKRGEFHWREWVPQLEAMQKLKGRASSTQHSALIELGDGNSPVALASFSDHHMGAWSADYSLLRALTDELLKTKNLYIGLLGDYGQYSIKLRNVLEVSDNMLPPEQQTQFIESWFDEIWHKVAFATWDNHGVERQEKQAGESSLKKLLSKRVVYFNGIGHVDIKVGSQIYQGCVSHTFRGRSFLNPVHSLMRYMRFEGQDREWAMAGDSHVPGMMKYTDGAKVRVAVNSGSLQANSGYAKRYFSLTTHPVYPLIVLHPDRHEISPFWSVREWLSLRGSK